MSLKPDSQDGPVKSEYLEFKGLSPEEIGRAHV
jgi:hypothetical protein